jgi:hypothetical protein
MYSSISSKDSLNEIIGYSQHLLKSTVAVACCIFNLNLEDLYFSIAIYACFFL